ncbi:MAG: hypothetical protein LBS72_02080 [Oscillospiraceae bacterium]|nr:hypothetical protein [Oscillospiraceae bacterium]
MSGEVAQDEPGLSDEPEYSPDGQYIWFNSVRSGLMQLYRMRVDGSEQTRITDDARNNWFAHLSPDGRLVAYISYRTDEAQPGDHPANKHVEIRLISAERCARWYCCLADRERSTSIRGRQN